MVCRKYFFQDKLIPVRFEGRKITEKCRDPEDLSFGSCTSLQEDMYIYMYFCELKFNELEIQVLIFLLENLGA